MLWSFSASPPGQRLREEKRNAGWRNRKVALAYSILRQRLNCQKRRNLLNPFWCCSSTSIEEDGCWSCADDLQDCAKILLVDLWCVCSCGLHNLSFDLETKYLNDVFFNTRGVEKPDKLLLCRKMNCNIHRNSNVFISVIRIQDLLRRAV